MHRFEVCADFCVHSRASGKCALFRCYLTVMRACVPYVFLVHADLIIDCIVLDLLEMHFWSMSELMSV
jgi:hypothetical protein